MGTWKPPSFYDELFRVGEEYKGPASSSRYLPVWDRAVSKVIGMTSIFDLGCGPGQVAEVCDAKLGAIPYIGLDTSEEAVRQAKARKYQRLKPVFLVMDITSPEAMALVGCGDRDMSAILCFEMLEHLQDDLAFMALLLKSAAVKVFVGSVPRFDCESHLRWFDTVDSVMDRYSPYLGSLEVARIGDHFLLHGTICG